MQNVTFTMTDFTFPEGIDDAHSTFRIYLALTYADKDGKYVTAKEIMPGAGEKDYWECEKEHSDNVRAKDAPKIDISKIRKSTARARFAGLEFTSLKELVVTIYDVEKDGPLDKFWRKGAKIAFGAALDLLPVGTAITVGNILKAAEKKPDDRSEIEKQLDQLIDDSKKQGKTRYLTEDIVNLTNLKNGDPVTASGDSKWGDFTVKFSTEIS